MDKETLSNYGWVVICVLVLAVMIALAGPFGNFVADAVKSTTQGLFDVNQNALDAAGITIDDNGFDASSENESLTNVVRFGETYTGINNHMGICEFVFYEDGSARMKSYIFHLEGGESVFSDEVVPAGTMVYNGTEIQMAGEPFFTLSADGNIISFVIDVSAEENGAITEWEETVELSVYEERTLPIMYNELYTNDNGMSIVFLENGTAYCYQDYALVFTWQYKIVGSQVASPLIFDVIDNGNAIKTYDGEWVTFTLESGKFAELS